MILGLPILAVLLKMTLWDAFLLEIGFFAFFLFYTYAFNLLYDILRDRWFLLTKKTNQTRLSQP
ncbi:chlorhexidine efflux transporter [Providencia hangzhouensis]